MFGFLTFALYISLVLTRTLDPTSKVIKLNYWVLLGLFIFLIALSYVNLVKGHNYIYAPLTVLLFVELALSFLYRRLKDTADDRAVYYVNDLYSAVAMYLLTIPILTFAGLIYMLCTG